MKKKWITALAVVCAIALVVGCSNGTDESDDPTPIAVESVTLSSSALTLEQGKSYTLSVNITPWNADDKTVTWSSSDTAVARVYSDGDVLAIKGGTATITARVGGKTATCEVTVKPLVESISLDIKTLTLGINMMRKLEATVSPIGAYNNTVIWESSDTTVATVNYDGNVTAVNVGTVTITAKVGDMKEECTIIIVNPQDIPTHTHDYSGGTCSVCGLWKPSIVGGTIDNYGILTKYTASEYQTRIYIPEGVTGIGDKAFKGCENLEKVTIPEGVTSIGKGAFYGCWRLTEITIPDSVTRIGNDAFYNCHSLTNVTIPKGVTNIGNNTFYYCSSLKSIAIPEGVRSIGEEAFYNCGSLTSITIPCSVITIGYSAFKGCRSITNVTIPEGVKTIGEDAFYICTKLKSVTIPNSITSIGEDAFSECTSLNSVNYNGIESEWKKIDRCQGSGEYSGLYIDGLSGKTITGKDGNTWKAAGWL